MADFTQPGSAPVIPVETPVIDHRDQPYLKRIDLVVRQWLAGEWETLSAIAVVAEKRGWTKARQQAYAAAALTPETLARRLDNISYHTLRRELERLGAPSPGDLIRSARLQYACHLLVSTRLKIRDVAARTGYDSDKHFSMLFTQTYGLSPRAYRNAQIGKKPRRK